MKNKLNIYNMFTFKVGINALSICVLSLMVLPIHAEEKTLTTDAMSAVAAALNVGNNPEEVVAEIPADVNAAVEKKLLSKIKINKAEIDPAAAQVFRASIYEVKPLLGYISIVDGEVLDLNY
ncbi:MAG: hypothetical protein L3J52_01470 [Proteobacteria bacterium]|nr:hypothetical protein [Pseudomonadota bacterium]